LPTAFQVYSSLGIKLRNPKFNAQKGINRFQTLLHSLSRDHPLSDIVPIRFHGTFKPRLLSKEARVYVVHDHYSHSRSRAERENIIVSFYQMRLNYLFHVYRCTCLLTF